MENCSLLVGDLPLVTKTNIDSLGASSCKIFLLSGIYKDQPFAYLEHDVTDCEDGTPLDVLNALLEFLVHKLEQNLIALSSIQNFTGLSNIHLILVGGQKNMIFYVMP